MFLSLLNNSGSQTEQRQISKKYALMFLVVSLFVSNPIFAQVIEHTIVKPAVNTKISDLRKRAHLIYMRITGVRVSIDHPDVIQMESLLIKNKYLDAAAIATDTPHFLNFVVRNFAAKMSTRNEEVSAPLSDFVATIIGATRDELDARTLLTGNYYYSAENKALPNVRSMVYDHIVNSNQHYADLEIRRIDLKQSLEKVDGQKIHDPSSTAEVKKILPMPEASGLLTSRAWMQAHAIAGTNRRLIEFSFQQFLCAPLESWASNGSEARIARDVDRFPSGDHKVYQTSCKTCHSSQDPLRGAYAKFDYADGRVKHSDVFPGGTGGGQIPKDRNGVVSKYNRNGDVYPNGYITTDNSWVNFAASQPANQQKFGWRSPAGESGVAEGVGVRSYGEMLANSVAFSQCMTKKVFVEVCKREPANFELPALNSVAEEFESSSYNLKKLFQRVVILDECIGKE